MSISEIAGTGLDPSFLAGYLRQLAPEQLRAAFLQLMPAEASREERVAAIQDVLRSPAGSLLRTEMGRWIVEHIVPVEALVPEAYAAWRPPVRDAMLFVVSHLSDARLAPKLLEQIELPLNTTPEARLLLLIAKVPGLQKLGQVIARNRHLRPALREALAELENGIHDITAEDVCAIIRRQLGKRLAKYGVEIEAAILSEASVSAVVRFTWMNPQSGERERGVFKVLKPHIPACFAEDMDILQRLAEFFGARHEEYGTAAKAIPDTFTKVRQLLEHEVNFRREQATLLEAAKLYRRIRGVRVPRVIRPLCMPTITAISEEHGAKVTSAVTGMSGWRRGRVAQQLIEALVAVPLFAAERAPIFHADPHAGNLLYNGRTGELVALDWALTDRLTREQRRHLALLVFMVGLRDRVGAANEVRALSQRGKKRDAQIIRETVTRFLDELPLTRLPGVVDAMKLLEQVAVTGVRFPAPLIMFSKVLFTLDGILGDVAGSYVSMSFTMMWYLLQKSLTSCGVVGSPLTAADLLTLQCSGLLWFGRTWVQTQQTLVDRLLPPRRAAAVVST